MRMHEFKKACKLADVDHWEIEKRFDPAFAGYSTFTELVKKCGTADDVLTKAFCWYEDAMPNIYWEHTSSLLTSTYNHVANPGKYLEDSVIEDPVTKSLIIGCQTINMKRQQMIFRLLAKRLGYEIEE